MLNQESCSHTHNFVPCSSYYFYNFEVIKFLTYMIIYVTLLYQRSYWVLQHIPEIFFLPYRLQQNQLYKICIKGCLKEVGQQRKTMKVLQGTIFFYNLVFKSSDYTLYYITCFGVVGIMKIKTRKIFHSLQNLRTFKKTYKFLGFS